jgi:CRP/FNR family cyclic AMP-dependent transcriptional regulator
MKVIGLFKNAQKTISVPAGAVVFEEGDVGEEMFGIIDGAFELRTTDRLIDTLGPDDVFGEMAVVDKSPRMATAIALEDSTLAVIDRHRFLFLVQETPMFALSVMSSMAARLRSHA